MAITLDPAKVAQQDERLTKKAEREVLKQEIVIDQVFDQLKRATPDQINTFINNTFGNLNAQQRMVIKMLVHVAAITVREMVDE